MAALFLDRKVDTKSSQLLKNLLSTGQVNDNLANSVLGKPQQLMQTKFLRTTDSQLDFRNAGTINTTSNNNKKLFNVRTSRKSSNGSKTQFDAFAAMSRVNGQDSGHDIVHGNGNIQSSADIMGNADLEDSHKSILEEATL